MSHYTNGRDSGRWTTTRGSLPALYSADVQPAEPAQATPAASMGATEPSAAPPLPVAAELRSVSDDLHDPPPSSLDELPAVPEADGPVVSLEADVDERRNFPRRDLGEALHVTLSGREIEVQGVDISRGGIRCEPLPYWTRRGDPVLVKLPAPHFHALGRVVWVQPLGGEEDQRIGGIRFTSPLAYL